MGQIVKFCVLTGLRPSEAVESVRLLNMNHTPNSCSISLEEAQKWCTYYNPERQALEHFRYPDIFLRTTKKAYISFVTADMIDEVDVKDASTVPSYNAIRLTCRRRGIMCDMSYCRKIFASYLHKQGGISDIMIDMLQGRTPKSVLVQRYLTPTTDYREKILAVVDMLKNELEV